MQITVKNAVRLLNVPIETIYQWIRQEEIPYILVNDQYYFNRVELLEWATANGIQISAELFSGKVSDKTESTVVYDALKSGGVFYNVKGTDMTTVLKSVVNLLKLPEDADRNFLYEVLLARETLGSTGIGNGIAIPHVRNPVVLNITKPSITICFLEKAIDFNAVDGKPVNILFTIISNTVSIHLHMLSRLAYMLTNQDFKKLLQSHTSPEKLFDMIRQLETEITVKEEKNIKKNN